MSPEGLKENTVFIEGNRNGRLSWEKAEEELGRLGANAVGRRATAKQV